jgi:hypothetical protein
MAKFLQKTGSFSYLFIPAFLLGFSNAVYADTMPDVYNFLPPGALATLNIKTASAAWPLFSTNKSLNKVDFFKELKTDKNDGPLDVILDPQVKNNLGDNLLVSLSAEDTAKDPQILIVMEMKNPSKTDYIKSKFNKMFLTGKAGKLIEAKYRDTKIYSYIAKDPKNTNYEPSFLAFNDNYVLMTNNYNYIQDSMKSYYREAPGISYSSDFTKSFAKLGSENQLQVYLDMKKLGKFVSGMDKSGKIVNEMNTSMFKNLFLNNSMMINFQINPQNVELKTYSVADKSTNFYKTMQESKPSDFKKYANFVPKNALLFMGLSDLKGAGQTFKDLFSFDKSLDFGSLIREATGIDIFDFADNLKNDMAITAFNTESNPLIPGFAFFMTPRDKGKMDLMLRSVKIDLDSFEKKGQKGNRRQKESESHDKPEVIQFNNTSTYKDITIYQTNELASLSEMNARPAYAYLGEDVILASNEEAIKSIIDRSAATAPDFTLNGNPSYLKFKDAFGQDTNSIFFLNLSTIVNMLSSFLAGEKDAKDLVTNLKKFEAIGSSSLNDPDGSLGHILILADLQNIDFDKLLPADKKVKAGKKTDKKAESKKKK